MTSNNRVELRLFTEQNIEQTYSWIGDYKLRQDFGIDEIPSYENHVNYFIKKLNASNELIYAIYLEDQYIGNCGFKNMDLNLHIAELWVYIGFPDKRGHGVGGNVVKELIECGKQDLNLNHIYLHVFEDNIAAIKVYKKNGFNTVEGVSDEWSSRNKKVIRMELIIKR